MNNYSTKKASQELIEEITDALKNIRGWGSVEITVQDFHVVQITERNIKKTSEKTKSITGIKNTSQFSNFSVPSLSK